jgi:tagaturonate reductase
VNAAWPAGAYDRDALPERVLQFGTGMLLRALVADAVDAANRTGAFNGRIAVVQNTAAGVADQINRQGGLFTLLERGIVHGEPVQRTRLIGAFSRALHAHTEWNAVREVAARPELRVITSNVTEGGFRFDDDEPAFDTDRDGAPRSYPAKLTDLLFTRFTRLPDGPSLLVIPTELVDANGPRLAAMVDTLASGVPRAGAFREWLAAKVRFCSSLVDRITTGAPTPEAQAEIESRLGYRDALLTVTEPHSLWAIEGDPARLREGFAIDGASAGSVIFAPDIARYRDRKLRLLNGAHTAMAPIALMTGVRTVRESVEHPKLGPLLKLLLFDEIARSMSLPPGEAALYAEGVLERFRNPWLDHEWRVIATNQTAKFRTRVVPSIVEFARRFGTAPRGLMVALAASLQFARTMGRSDGEGWWGDHVHRIVDVDRGLIDRHWQRIDALDAGDPLPAAALANVVEQMLGDAAIWGQDLRILPGLVEAVTQALATIQQ